MKVRCKQSFRNFFRDGIYQPDEEGEGFIILDSTRYDTDNSLFLNYFEIIEEAPKLYRSHEETADDILEWYGDNCADPTVEMSKEIHMLRKALHEVKNELSGKLGSVLAIVDLSREHQKKIETLMKLAQPTE